MKKGNKPLLIYASVAKKNQWVAFRTREGWGGGQLAEEVIACVQTSPISFVALIFPEGRGRLYTG